MSSQRVLGKLQEVGLLLLSDKALPSVVALVAGPRVKGSWWGHERGHEIFRELEKLEAHPDSLTTRLISGKVTYLHRRLWPDFLSLATSREVWQTKGLSSEGRRLLTAVNKVGQVRMDAYVGGKDAAKEIERRLLVYTEDLHTERGSHTKLLSTWSRCPKLRDLRFSPRSLAAAKEALEGLVDALNGKYGADGRLPWRQ
jgi:hypothetical protein